MHDSVLPLSVLLHYAYVRHTGVRLTLATFTTTMDQIMKSPPQQTSMIYLLRGIQRFTCMGQRYFLHKMGYLVIRRECLLLR